MSTQEHDVPKMVWAVWVGGEEFHFVAELSEEAEEINGRTVDATEQCGACGGHRFTAEIATGFPPGVIVPVAVCDDWEDHEGGTTVAGCGIRYQAVGKAESVVVF